MYLSDGDKSNEVSQDNDKSSGEVRERKPERAGGSRNGRNGTQEAEEVEERIAETRRRL